MDSVLSENGARISREETELLRELLSGADAVPAQGPMEKGNGGSNSAGERSSGYAGHPAHLHCWPPPTSNFNSVLCRENRGTSD